MIIPLDAAQSLRIALLHPILTIHLLIILPILIGFKIAGLY
jgi:hypothetical protein